MRYQELIVTRLKKMDERLQQIEYSVKRAEREDALRKLKDLREDVQDTTSLAEKTQ